MSNCCCRRTCCRQSCCCCPCYCYYPYYYNNGHDHNGHDRTYTLGGTIFGTDSQPVAAGMEVQLNVNGAASTTTTNSGGRYSITVPKYSSVTITPVPGVGVNVTPANYTISPVLASNMNLNFNLSAIIPN